MRYFRASKHIADGNFELLQVPAGPYELYALMPDGWRLEHDNPTLVQVNAAYPAQLYLEAEPGEAPQPTPPDCGAPA